MYKSNFSCLKKEEEIVYIFFTKKRFFTIQREKLRFIWQLIPNHIWSYFDLICCLNVAPTLDMNLFHFTGNNIISDLTVIWNGSCEPTFIIIKYQISDLVYIHYKTKVAINFYLISNSYSYQGTLRELRVDDENLGS